MSYTLAQTIAAMGMRYPAVLQSEDLQYLPEGSVVIWAKNGEIKELTPGRARAYAKLNPGDWWVVIWKGQPCLVCRQFGTHRFAVAGKVDGWLCEEHKDDPVEIDGKIYGARERR